MRLHHNNLKIAFSKIGATFAVIVLLVAGVMGASVSAAPTECMRYAAVPALVSHGDDFAYVHTAASAMYCPNNVFVQITTCVQNQSASGWTDVGCQTSNKAYVSKYTRGGRGVATTFDVPCVSGVLRTHVTGGEGIGPSEWNSDTTMVNCTTTE